MEPESPMEEMGIPIPVVHSRRGRSKKPTTLPTTLKIKQTRPSLAKRRGFEGNVVVHGSPTPHPEGFIPHTPQTPMKPQKKNAFRYSSKAINMITADVLYDNEVRDNPENAGKITCKGRLFMGSAKSLDESSRNQRLFFNLGQNLYLEKQPDKTGVGEGSLRLSLWKNNSIDKLQRVGARFSITLNFDAILQIKRESDDIKTGLSLTDNENFVGYCLSLGQMIFLTVDPDICSVNLRKWYKPTHLKDDPEGDLFPSREGIRLSYEQFKRFVEFLDTQLTTEFPSFDTHVFCCDRMNHDPHRCNVCNVKGLLPIQREFKRLVALWFVIFYTITHNY